MNRFLSAVCCSILLAASTVAQDATLRMRFVFDGDPPPPKRINLAPRFAPPGGPVIDESLLIDPKSNGIKNVLVYVYTGRRGSQLDSLPKPAGNRKRRLTMMNARFDPHILIAQAGDTLELIERGPIQHNPRLNFFANNAQGILFPPGKPRLIPVPKAEPAPIPVDCHIHPWMRAYVAILDHPFAAVSDSDGHLMIEGLPSKTSLMFRVFHEAGRVDRVKMSGVETAWPRSRFEVDLDVGTNDLGDILIPSTLLVD